MRPPKLVLPRVLTFLRKVVREVIVEPYYVPAAPVASGRQNNCFAVVEKHAAAHGGSSLIGWAVWEWPGVFIEAEFHAIWIQPNGAPLDIVPRPVRIPRILFIPDRQRRHYGRQIENIRHPLARDPDIEEFFRLAGRRFALRNEGDSDTYKLTRELIEVEQQAAAIETKLAQRYGRWECEAS